VEKIGKRKKRKGIGKVERYERKTCMS